MRIPPPLTSKSLLCLLLPLAALALATCGPMQGTGKSASPGPNPTATPIPIDTAKVFLIEEVKTTERSDTVLGTLSEEIKTCGISRLGPRCLDTQFTEAHPEAVDSLKSTDSIASFSVFTKTGSDRSFILVIEEDRNKNTKILIFNHKANSGIEKFKTEYTKIKTTPTLEAIVPVKSEAFALNKLSTLKEVKALFHFSVFSVQQNPSNRKFVARILQDQLLLITQKSSDTYQLGFLKWFRQHLSDQKELRIKFSKDAISSDNSHLNQLAAITLVETGHSTPSIQQKVRAALLHWDSQYRAAAVTALNKVKEGSEDENRIIAMLLDDDSAVYTAALAIVAGLTLDNDNLPAISLLVHHSNPTFRLDGIQILKRIGTPEAKALGAELQSDPDPRIKEIANTF